MGGGEPGKAAMKKIRGRVLIVSPGGLSDSGGVERVMRYAARFFALRGLPVVVIDRERLFRSASYRLLGAASKGPFAPILESAAFSLLAHSLARPGDFVISNGFAAAFYPSDILFCHGSMRGSRFAVKGRRSLWGPEELLELLAGKLARRVVAVSAKAGREWAAMYGTRRGKIRVVPNCVDAHLFAPSPEGATGRYGERDTLRVLFVGRLERRKGTDRLLRAIEAAGADMRFVVATPSADGAGEFRGRPSIDLRVGVAMADLPALYRGCDVMYFPSRYEGFEMVSLESLSCGTPIVGTRVGGMAELSAHGFPGLVILQRPDDPTEALGALRRLSSEWRDPARKESLHEATEREYGVDAWFASLDAAIGDIIESGEGR
jgi:glycosyltransferase involved in cell wall biosynthesis